MRLVEISGCRHTDSGDFIEPGTEYTDLDGRECACVSGQDPMLADTSSKYYIACDDGNELNGGDEYGAEV